MGHFFLKLPLSYFSGRGFWLSPEDTRLPKPHNLACQGLAQEDSDAKPAYFLGAAGPLPSPSLVETAISSLPPDAEVPQHPVSLAQSSQDDTEVRHTGVSVKRKRKQGKYLSDLLTRPQRFFYFEPIRQKWDPGDWHLTLARE